MQVILSACISSQFESWSGGFITVCWQVSRCYLTTYLILKLKVKDKFHGRVDGVGNHKSID